MKSSQKDYYVVELHERKMSFEGDENNIMTRRNMTLAFSKPIEMRVN